MVCEELFAEGIRYEYLYEQHYKYDKYIFLYTDVLKTKSKTINQTYD